MQNIVRDIDPNRSFWLAITPGAAHLELPYFCTEAGKLYGQRHFLTERSHKDSYLLLYTLEGAGKVTQGGRSVLLRRSQALLLDCRRPQSYGTAASEDVWHHLWAHVDGPGVDTSAKRLGLPALAPTYVRPSHTEPQFESIFGLLEHESLENAERVSLAVHALLAELTISSLRSDSTPDDPVRRACDYIAEHLPEAMSVADLAAATHVSTSYLTRLFRKTMGTSPHDYLIRQRVTRAKELLVETDMDVGRIAREVGFGCASSFSYRFSRATGDSPSAYRQITQGAHLRAPS